MGMTTKWAIVAGVAVQVAIVVPLVMLWWLWRSGELDLSVSGGAWVAVVPLCMMAAVATCMNISVVWNEVDGIRKRGNSKG